MKQILLCGFLFLSLTAQAADIEATAVVLRGVDKITGRTQTNQIKIGQPVQVHNIRITAQRCLKKPPEETPENAAFLIIEEEKNSTYQVIFNGWMFSSNPAISSLEHPVFDIWVLDCLAPDNEKEQENKDSVKTPVLSTDKVQIDALENIE
ncbi:MAG: DUF2155 domain-containing protein [Alphaproteobacteria bacterium]|nr:DUF2155 domain-containing protein [Alphaproteobacteria bacterium]